MVSGFFSVVYSVTAAATAGFGGMVEEVELDDDSFSNLATFGAGLMTVDELDWERPALQVSLSGVLLL